jgi:signal transduction histidine kinase
MKRPRLALSLFNPRRRLRDRLLAAMLTVALVPTTALFVLTAVNLSGITRAAVNGAVNGLVSHSEGTFQNQLTSSANTIQIDLDAVLSRVRQLASLLVTPSPKATASPTAGAASGSTASPAASSSPASPAASSNPDAPGNLEFTQVGGVYEIHTPSVEPSSAELLVGSAPKGNTHTVASRAGTLATLSPFAGESLATAAAKVGNLVDAVWLMDPTDNAVWISPGNITLPAQGQGVALNPQGAPLDLLTLVPPSSPSLQTPTPGQARDWTQPYQNPLHGGDWEVTVYAVTSDGLVIGADVPLAQFESMIADAPSATSSYPLLLDGSNRVIAAGDTKKDFTAPLTVGSKLPVAAGKQGPALIRALSDAEEGTAGQPPITATIGGTDRLFFTATVSDPQWTLVDSVPKANFEPNSSAIQGGVNKAITNIFRDAIPIVAALLVIAFLLATALSRFIVAPVRALNRSAERLAQGHTDEPVPPQRRDEIGDLADSLERMRREINASREVILAASRELEQKVAIRTAELSVRNEELLALNELAGSLTRSLDPEAILAGALDAVRAVLPTTAGRGYRLSREGLLTASRGEPEERSPLLENVAGAAIADNHLITRADGDGVLIGLPMGTGAGPLGALGLRATVTPGAEMTALLMAIGNQVGLALSTARLSEEGREMAVLEERARLAREIHDTLAQQLTGIVIQLEAAQALVNRDPDRSLPALASAQELARSALAEARRSVWDLRPTPLSSTGLVAAVEHEVGQFRRRTGIATRLRTERMVPPPALRPQAEVTLLRITQQALANIAAHSGASRVTVRLRNLGDHVELTVKDNGHGFDTSALPLGSFGIVGMAERARVAGGSFQVESIAGRGTTVTVHLPVTTEARVEGAALTPAIPV